MKPNYSLIKVNCSLTIGLLDHFRFWLAIKWNLSEHRLILVASNLWWWRRCVVLLQSHILVLSFPVIGQQIGWNFHRFLLLSRHFLLVEHLDSYFIFRLPLLVFFWDSDSYLSQITILSFEIINCLLKVLSKFNFSAILTLVSIDLNHVWFYRGDLLLL